MIGENWPCKCFTRENLSWAEAFDCTEHLFWVGSHFVAVNVNEFPIITQHVWSVPPCDMLFSQHRCEQTYSQRTTFGSDSDLCVSLSLTLRPGTVCILEPFKSKSWSQISIKLFFLFGNKGETCWVCSLSSATLTASQSLLLYARLLYHTICCGSNNYLVCLFKNATAVEAAARALPLELYFSSTMIIDKWCLAPRYPPRPIDCRLFTQSIWSSCINTSTTRAVLFSFMLLSNSSVNQQF